jgi:glycosyltransferase involved in cell wall biosynthesis
VPDDCYAEPAPLSGWICFSGQDWWYHNRAHSDFQLMRRVAAHRPVLFVNSIGMRMPLPGRSSGFARRIWRKVKSVLRYVRQPVPELPLFHVFTPLIVPFYGVPALRALNAWLVRTQVRLVARSLGIRPEAAVIFLTVPTAAEVVRSLPRRSLLYNRSDMHSAFGEANQPYIRALEAELFRASDSVLYTSHALMAAEAARTAERARFLDHGVDVDHFVPASDGGEPADVRGIPRPRIGFFGGIDDYVVDLALMEHVARALPDAALVIVGDATCSMDRLTALPNVHWLGFRPYETVPAYGRSFDVAIMPWLRNDWIEHCNPIKLKEYLALGLPIVSTDFPEVRHYADVVGIGTTPDEFLERIRDALRGGGVGTRETRRARVESSTWDRQAHRLLQLGEGTR